MRDPRGPAARPSRTVLLEDGEGAAGEGAVDVAPTKRAKLLRPDPGPGRVGKPADEELRLERLAGLMLWAAGRGEWADRARASAPPATGGMQELPLERLFGSRSRGPETRLSGSAQAGRLFASCAGTPA